MKIHKVFYGIFLLVGVACKLDCDFKYDPYVGDPANFHVMEQQSIYITNNDNTPYTIKYSCGTAKTEEVSISYSPIQTYNIKPLEKNIVLTIPSCQIRNYTATSLRGPSMWNITLSNGVNLKTTNSYGLIISKGNISPNTPSGGRINTGQKNG